MSGARLTAAQVERIFSADIVNGDHAVAERKFIREVPFAGGIIVHFEKEATVVGDFKISCPFPIVVNSAVIVGLFDTEVDDVVIDSDEIFASVDSGIVLAIGDGNGRTPAEEQRYDEGKKKQKFRIHVKLLIFQITILISRPGT